MMEVEERVPREKISTEVIPLPNNIAIDLLVLAEQLGPPPLRIVAIRSRSVTNQRAIWDRDCSIARLAKRYKLVPYDDLSANMSVELNHIIIWCRDQRRSSSFLAEILGRP